MRKLFALMTACLLAFPGYAYAATEERELTEFCSVYGIRFNELSKINNLGLDFYATASAPSAFGDNIFFTLGGLEIVVDAHDFRINEISTPFTDSKNDTSDDSRVMARLISMVSALEYGYMEDIAYKTGGEYGLVESPTKRAFDVVQYYILPAYGAIDPDTLVRSDGELFFLYEGNYSYYARFISMISSWVVDVVALPHS